MDIQNIVITGVSGRFPNTNNVEDLKQALINGTDLITDHHQRWPYETLQTPPSLGIVQDFERFDAAFFEVNPKSADLQDPRGRKLLEVVYESITDAGINPVELRGSNTGVFLALMQNSPDGDHQKPCSSINSTTYMIVNNISYNFDFHGPSCGIDTGCSSSIYAISQAVDSIRFGRCDSAIICSAHANFLPHDSMEFDRLGVLNPDGRCRTFDEDRKGYVKSEAVVSIFLQKKQSARRIYATISGVGCNTDGHKEDGIVHPSSRMQIALFKDVYQRFNIDPNSVTYVDCHGTGTLVGDIEECQGLAEFFATGERLVPLKIGSVKTNLGHTEAAGGLVSLVKLLIAIQAEVIPSNLHFRNVAKDIPALNDGRLTVISQNTPYKGGQLAVNSFGLGGANGHLVIKPYPKIQNTLQVDSKTCRLVQVSGRTEFAVQTLLDKIKNQQNHPGFLSLIDHIFSREIKNHNYRGFVVLNSSVEAKAKCSFKSRPIWFSYSGMGSQWPKMGKELMHFQVFKNTFKKCADVVKPYGVNLEDIVLNDEKDIFEDAVNCFTSIVAISVALTDLLGHFGIKPDGIIGHSLGEIGCAYADGLLTAEQATLVAYARGWATKNTILIKGLMASVSLSSEKCEKLLPSDIFLACDNSTDNVTISGPEKSVKMFTEQLQESGIFVRIVNTANIAFHSRYVEDVGPKLLEFLKTVIPGAGLRKRWLSSAVPENQWDSDLGKYNSAEYHHYNFMNKVLYRQVLGKVPIDAILVEISPSGLFQAIFKRSLVHSITSFCLMKKNCDDNQKFLLKALGNIYLAGGPPMPKNLCETSKLPVGPETPMISPLIKWNHTVKWSIPKYKPCKLFGKTVEIDLTTKENKFLLGHVINGTNIYPTSGYIILVWKTFAALLGEHFEKLPVVIEKLIIQKTTILTGKDSITFTVNIMRSGTFEISDDMDLVATGRIFAPKNIRSDFFSTNSFTQNKIHPETNLCAEEVYQILKLRGYDYDRNCRGILEIDCSNRSTRVKWNNTWISFLDSVFQSASFFEKSTLVIPNKVSEIIINPLAIGQVKAGEIIVKYNNFIRTASCSLVEIKNITWNTIPYKQIKDSVMKYKHLFVPNIILEPMHEKRDEVLRIALQIVTENNVSSPVLHIAEVLDEYELVTYQARIKKVLHPLYLKHLNYNLLKNFSAPTGPNCNLVIDPNLENNVALLRYLKNASEGTFVYNEQESKNLTTVLGSLGFAVVFKRKSVSLFKKVFLNEGIYGIVKFNGDDLSWMRGLQVGIKEDVRRVILVDECSDSAVTGVLNFIKEKMCTSKVRIFCIKDSDAEKFSLDSKFYQEQLRKDLVINVLENDEWGTYRDLPIAELRNKHVESCFASVIGDKIHWLERDPYRFASNEVDVWYSSIDLWDLRSIIPEKRGKLLLGLEYSGTTASGVRLMGLSPDGHLTTHLVPHQNLTWTVPNEWKLKEAATVPYACVMSYYGLFSKGNLQPHSTILITYNSHSIDLAAISFSLNIRCKVFVGVNTSKYANQIASCFPKLKHNIVDFSARNCLDVMMRKTKGQGVDMIFNYGESNPVRSALDVLKEGGKVINLSKNEENFFPGDRNYVEYKITLRNLLAESYYVLEDIRSGIEEYVRFGVIKPFPSQTIDMTKITNLFKHIDGTDQSGKITVKMHREKYSSLGQKGCFLATPRTYFNPEKSYLIVSDLKMFDLEVIKWLCRRGARKIIVNSKTEKRSGLQRFWLDNIQKEGCSIVVKNIDITSVEGAKDLVHTAFSIGDIGGIFLFVMDVKERSFMSLRTDFKKIHNLDITSRDLCQTLDYFVVLSSSGRDSLGRSFSSYLNVKVQDLCETRRQQNLAALAIQWGPIDEAAQKSTSKSSEEYSQSIDSCLENLDTFLQLGHTSVSSAVYNNHEVSANSSSISAVESVAKIFGIRDVDQTDFSTPLVNLGMDSITGFEMKNLLSSQFNVNFSISDIRKLTLDDIKRLEQENCNHS